MDAPVKLNSQLNSVSNYGHRWLTPQCPHLLEDEVISIGRRKHEILAVQKQYITTVGKTLALRWIASIIAFCVIDHTCLTHQLITSTCPAQTVSAMLIHRSEVSGHFGTMPNVLMPKCLGCKVSCPHKNFTQQRQFAVSLNQKCSSTNLWLTSATVCSIR